MTCVNCGTPNAPGAKFCVECGTALTLACPACGAAVTASQRFCAECGTPLGVAAVTAPPTSAVERRMCSILFCDLVGFTPISEARDPEAVRELLDRYFDTARTVIARYGGAVEKFIGDAVMAVWGTPVATEDDAERTVRAALELVEAVAALGRTSGVPDLAARAGVVTAEVAVNLTAVGQGMVAGDPVNTAARIQAAAEPGQVLTDDATGRLVRAAIDLEDAGDHALKGKTAAQHLWLATRVLAAVGGAQRIDGLEAPLIGRDVELRIVKDLFHATVERGTSQLVTILGDVGSGKSRLGWEFEKYVDGLATTVLWHRGRCLAYGDGVAFWALTEMIRQRLGIADEDPPEVALTLLLEALDRYVADETERVFVGTRLARLLGLQHPADDGRELERNDLFAGWRIWLTRLADTAPVVWVLEDVQFADSGLLDFVDHLLDWAKSAPIHLLALSRPQIDDVRAGWTTGRRRQVIALDPLDDAAMTRLLDALVADLPAAAARRIADQAQGVPLFAVETIRSLIDRDLVVPRDGRYRLVGDLGELTVPDGLRAVFAARLDHLDTELRDLVATAAVLGTTFPAESLAVVADRPLDQVRSDLDRLVTRDLLSISADPLSPQRGSYGFTHDLLRRVAVETLARREQRARHLRVAEHLRTTFPDDGEEVADVIAQHLLDAVAAVPDAEDAGSQRERAVRELIRSAGRAGRLGAPRRAALAFAKAAAQSTDPGASAALLERSAQWSFTSGDHDRAVEVARQASALFLGTGERRRAAAADALGARALMGSSRFALARTQVEPAVAVLRVAPDLATVRAMNTLAGAAVFSGDSDARSLTEQAIGLAERIGAPDDELARHFLQLGLMHSFAGERPRALAAYRETARLATAAESWREASVAMSNMAADQLSFTPGEAADSANIALELARRAGSRDGVAFAVENLADALLTLGEWTRANELMADARRNNEIEDLVEYQSAVGRIAGLQGDAVTLRAARAAVELHAEDNVEVRCVAAHLALLELPAGADPSAVLAAARRVLAFVDEVGTHLLPVVDAWSAAARAAFHLGDEPSDAVRRVVAPFSDAELGPLLVAERSLAAARLADAPEAAFLDAIAAQRASSPPHLHAHGLLDWAEHRITNGRPSDALPLIEEAHAIAARLGAKPVAERAGRIRRRLPVTAP